VLFKRSELLSGHSAAVYGISAGSKPETILSASGDRFVVEWDIQMAQQNALAVKFEQPVFSSIYIEGENLLAAGTATGAIHIIDLNEKKEIHHLAVHSKGVYDFHYRKEDKQLIALGGDGLLTIWFVPSFKLLRKIPLSSEKLRQIAVSKEHGLIAIACGDGTLRLLEPNFFSEIRSINAHKQGATSVAWHPFKPVLLSGGRDAMIQCWNINEQYQNVLSIPAHNYAIYSIAFDDSEEYMATCSRDKTIKIWDAHSLDNLQRIDVKQGGHTHSVNKVLWLDKTLASCGDDRKIILWRQ